MCLQVSGDRPFNRDLIFTSSFVYCVHYTVKSVIRWGNTGTSTTTSFDMTYLLLQHAIRDSWNRSVKYKSKYTE